MADFQTPDSIHPTLSASTEDTVAIMLPYGTVEILNRGGDYIYFRTDGIPAVVRAPGTTAVQPGGSLRTSKFSRPSFPYDNTGYIKVRLISESSIGYSVQGVSQ